MSTAELAAYRTGGAIADGGGKVHDYSRKGGVAHCEIVLPAGIDADWAHDRAALWNQAEAVEVRKNSRVAREWRVALPHELDDAARIALARDFAAQIVDRYGVAADVAVHAPSRSGDQRNWHAHILCTSRTIGNEGFGDKAVIEWSNANLAKAGLPYTSIQIREMRMAWEAVSNAALDEAGRDERIDHRSHAAQGIALEAARTVHVGQIYAEERDRVEGTERILPVERLGAEQSAHNAALIADEPELILDRVTQSESVFTRQDVAKVLHRFVNDDWQAFEGTLNSVMASPGVVQVHEAGVRADGEYRSDVFTTRAMLEREGGMLETAERLASGRWERAEASRIERWRGRDAGLSEKGFAAATEAIPFLSDEQSAAIRHVGGDSQLAIVRGQAGTGKTTMLRGVREAADHDGVRVVGASLSGKAARELQDGSGIESRTLASLERSWEAGFDQLSRGDLLVIDEAGMVGAGQMSRVLGQVEQAGAKVVLVGDERQLQPIEAGAAFRNIMERIADGEANDRPAAAELSEVRRQDEAWQRQATNLFAGGEAGKALDLYREHGCVTMHAGTDVACAAMVEAHFDGLDKARAEWAASGRAGAPDHILTAYRNGDVDTLNRGVREERIARGELGEDHDYRTDRGTVAFAVGDQVLFTANDRELGVANGDRGVVTAAGEDRLSVMLRGQGGEAERASVDIEADRYGGIRHGYAVTTHRAQGMTVDRIEVLAGRGMDAPLAYVAMTRQREGAVMHGSEDDFRDYDALRAAVSRDRLAEGVGDYVPDRATFERLRAQSDERIAGAAQQTDHVSSQTPVIALSSERDVVDEGLIDPTRVPLRAQEDSAAERGGSNLARSGDQLVTDGLPGPNDAGKDPAVLDSAVLRDGRQNDGDDTSDLAEFADPDRGTRLRAMMAELSSGEDPQARMSRLQALIRDEGAVAGPHQVENDSLNDQDRIDRLRQAFQDAGQVGGQNAGTAPSETGEERRDRLRAMFAEKGDAPVGDQERETARVARLRAAFREGDHHSGQEAGREPGMLSRGSEQDGSRGGKTGSDRSKDEASRQARDSSNNPGHEQGRERGRDRGRGTSHDDGAER